MSGAFRLVATTLVLAASGVASSPDPAHAADGVELTLTAQPFTIAAGDAFTASFQVSGDLGAAAPGAVPPSTAPPSTTAPAVTVVASSLPVSTPPAGPPAPLVEARVVAHRPIYDRAGLQAVLDGDTGSVVSRVTVAVTLTAVDGATFLRVSVPTTTDLDVAPGLLLSRAGTYPTTVDLVVDGEVVASHDTLVERLPASAADGAPVHVAVVAGVDDPGPAPTPAELADAGVAIDGIAAGAVALAGVMSVRLPPSLVAGLDDTTLDELRASLAGTELLSSPALALDPSSAVAAGQEDTFSQQLRTGEDVLGAALPEASPRRSAWLVATALSAAAGATLREPLGFDLLVLDPDVYDGLEGNIGGFHDTTLGVDVVVDDGDRLLGVVAHPAGRWLDGRELASQDMSGTDGAIAILAELRITRRELGDDLRRSAVLAMPAGGSPDVGVLTALASYAAITPDIELTTLSELVSATDVQEVPGRGPESVTLPATAGTDLAERVGRIELTRINATGAGSMLIDRARVAAWDDELDALLSTALTDDEVDARLERISGEARAIYECVVAPNPFTLTLTGRSSTVRLNLANECAEDLRVVVHPTSTRLTFPDGDVARTLGANSISEVEVEVVSRSNGTSAIGIELLTPVGSLAVREPLVLTARVNALSGLGQVVTGGALLVLVSWWYGHFRRRRRVRRAMLGEVDNPVNVGPAVSPDAAEVTGDHR